MHASLLTPDVPGHTFGVSREESSSAVGAIQRFLGSRLSLSIAAAFGLCLHLSGGLSLYSLLDRFLSWCFLLILLFTLQQFVRQPRKVPVILIIAVLQYYVLFGAAVFTQEFVPLIWGIFVPNLDAITLALELALASELLFIGAFAFGGRKFTKAKAIFWRLFPEVPARGGFLISVYALLGVLVWSLLMLMPNSIPVSVRQILICVINPYLALALLFYSGYVGDRKLYRILAFAAMIAMSLLGLVHGMLVNFAAPLYIAILSMWLWSARRVALYWCAVASIAFLVLNPAKVLFRQQAYRDLNNLNVTNIDDVTERALLWRDAVATFWSSPFASREAVEATSQRTSTLLMFAQTVDWVPNVVPFKRGDGIGTAMLFFIPRLAWPSKPEVTFLYNRYAVDFGYLTYRGTKSTTVGTSLLSEGYWDFGAVGVLIYSALFGGLLGLFFGGPAGRTSSRLLVLVAYSAANFELLYAFTTFMSSLFSFFAGLWVAWMFITGAGGRLRGPG